MNKFNTLYFDLLLEQIDNSADVIICNSNDDMQHTVQKYFKEYYNDPNNLRTIKTGHSEESGEPVYEKSTCWCDYLSDDIPHLTYVREEFNWYSSHSNEKWVYFIILSEGHLIGMLKYWLESSSEQYPCIGFISVNDLYKHKGYGIKLLDATFKYHKNRFPNEPLIITDFSEEGQQYIKHICERLSKKYDVGIFTTDDYRDYYRQQMYSNSSMYNSTLNLKKFEFDVPDKIKKDVQLRVQQVKQQGKQYAAV